MPTAQPAAAADSSELHVCPREQRGTDFEVCGSLRLHRHGNIRVLLPVFRPPLEKRVGSRDVRVKSMTRARAREGGDITVPNPVTAGGGATGSKDGPGDGGAIGGKDGTGGSSTHPTGAGAQAPARGVDTKRGNLTGHGNTLTSPAPGLPPMSPDQKNLAGKTPPNGGPIGTSMPGDPDPGSPASTTRAENCGSRPSPPPPSPTPPGSGNRPGSPSAA